MERHLTAGVSVLVALFAAHREADQSDRPDTGLSAADIDRIITYLEKSSLPTLPRPPHPLE